MKTRSAEWKDICIDRHKETAMASLDKDEGLDELEAEFRMPGMHATEAAAQLPLEACKLLTRRRYTRKKGKRC
jgi:hypothetical protein